MLPAAPQRSAWLGARGAGVGTLGANVPSGLAAPPCVQQAPRRLFASLGLLRQPRRRHEGGGERGGVPASLRLPAALGDAVTAEGCQEPSQRGPDAQRSAGAAFRGRGEASRAGMLGRRGWRGRGGGGGGRGAREPCAEPRPGNSGWAGAAAGALWKGTLAERQIFAAMTLRSEGDPVRGLGRERAAVGVQPQDSFWLGDSVSAKPAPCLVRGAVDFLGFPRRQSKACGRPPVHSQIPG